ncbi:MAG: hypothetical protein IJR61_07225 [Clostridia bacterium]|nr:hypothetical protein [Clostridia bacterium]
MKELIRKTALTTLAAAAGAILLGAVVLMLFFPSVVSDGAYGMGLYRVSATFARSAYEKDGEFSSLKTLVERAILAEKYDLVAGYAPAFIADDRFEDTAAAEDAGKSDERVGDYYSYVTGNLAVAQYGRGEREAALNTAALYTVRYERYNATEYLLKTIIDRDDKAFGSELLAEMKKYSFSGEEKALLDRDISILESFIG